MKYASSDKPMVCKISRREFVAITGFAAGAVVAGAVGNLQAQPDSPSLSRADGPYRLPKSPTPNPAFGAWETPNQEIVLWTQQNDRTSLSYRVNRNGRHVWSLCNGKSSDKDIAAEYHGITNRAAAEAHSFLKRLHDLGLIVSDSFVVPSNDFPMSQAGGWYRPVIDTTRKTM